MRITLATVHLQREREQVRWKEHLGSDPSGADNIGPPCCSLCPRQGSCLRITFKGIEQYLNGCLGAFSSVARSLFLCRKIHQRWQTNSPLPKNCWIPVSEVLAFLSSEDVANKEIEKRGA